MTFEQLKEKLEKEGLFDERYKKPIPSFPSKIGVVTSPTGAAIRDILNVLKRRYDFADVVICPVLVQGDGAAEQIARAISYANETKLCDVLIVGRGGGSIEDLWAFNEEVVARAIFESEIPVISAVGHETDFTIADFVADMRAPTPSAAAEISVPSKAELSAYLSGVKSRLQFVMQSRIESERKNLDRLSSKLSVEGVVRSYDQKRLIIDNKLKTLQQLTERKILGLKEHFSKNAATLHSLSPLGVLGRGFSVTKDDKGKTLKSVENIAEGDRILTVLPDGEIYSTVIGTERK